MAFLTGTNLLSLLLVVAAFFFITAGVRALRLGSRTIYFRHRRQRVLAGWWMSGAALLLVAIAALTFRPQNPFLVPASDSVVTAASMTAVRVLPSRTPPASPRPRPSATPTASATPAPRLPLSIEIMTISSVTPQTSASISDVRFSMVLDDVYPIGLHYEFANPVYRMYASFAYSGMTYGAQFTILWFRNGELVFFESGPWKEQGRGRSFSLWAPAMHEWHPGQYEVQFFVGTEWKATGRFTVTGEPRPATPTRTPIPTRTPRPTSSATPTLLPTSTPRK